MAELYATIHGQLHQLMSQGMQPTSLRVGWSQYGELSRLLSHQQPAAERPRSVLGLTIVPVDSASHLEVVAYGRKLGNHRHVTVGQVARIGERDKVRLVPICDTVHRSLTEEEMGYLARGNVQGLIRPISRNDTLSAALEDGG